MTYTGGHAHVSIQRPYIELLLPENNQTSHKWSWDKNHNLDEVVTFLQLGHYEVVSGGRAEVVIHVEV